jgi:hypothetical protein
MRRPPTVRLVLADGVLGSDELRPGGHDMTAPVVTVRLESSSAAARAAGDGGQPAPSPPWPPSRCSRRVGGSSDDPRDEVLEDRGALPRVVDADTPDGRCELPLDGSATLELPTDTTPPQVRGMSVELIDVASFQDPGAQRWELRSVAVGTTTIVAEVAGTARTWVVAVTEAPAA